MFVLCLGKKLAKYECHYIVIQTTIVTSSEKFNSEKI